MTALTDDEITARAIEQALRELPEPTREQAHDSVCDAIAGWATCNWDRLGDGGIDDMDILTDIRRLEHATRLLRGDRITVTYTQYFAPGSFLANVWEVSGAPAEWPENAYARQVWECDEIHADGVVYKAPARKVGKLVYHPDSLITTLAELESGETGLQFTDTLISNMRANRWGGVIWSRWGNWPQPWEPERMEIDHG